MSIPRTELRSSGVAASAISPASTWLIQKLYFMAVEFYPPLLQATHNSLLKVSCTEGQGSFQCRALVRTISSVGSRSILRVICPTDHMVWGECHFSIVISLLRLFEPNSVMRKADKSKLRASSLAQQVEMHVCSLGLNSNSRPTRQD